NPFINVALLRSAGKNSKSVVMDVLVMVEDLDNGFREVGNVVENSFVRDVTVQWVAMRFLVWVDSLVAIVVEL
ncbi:hypothetical protein CGJ15_25200, partial [Vibrio parahaemolyticus]